MTDEPTNTEPGGDDDASTEHARTDDEGQVQEVWTYAGRRLVGGNRYYAWQDAAGEERYYAKAPASMIGGRYTDLQVRTRSCRTAKPS